MKKKNIITLIIIITIILFDIIMPKATQATNEIVANNNSGNNVVLGSTGGGGSLVEPIAQFFCFIPDVVIDFLQDMFVSPQGIEAADGSYQIQYSPGIIFSGQVPAFDINFINPGEGKVGTETSIQHVSLIEALDLNGAKKIYEDVYTPAPFTTKKGIIKSIKKNSQYEYAEDREIDISLLEGKLQSNESDFSTGLFAGTTWDATTNTLECAWYNADKSKIYIIVDYYSAEQNTDLYGNVTYTTYGKIRLYELNSEEELKDATDITDTTTTTIISTKEYDSTAAILQPIVATWYNALRRIALVGLLSALVYIGIKILLSSTSAKDKAKYKNMLKDWLVALCILFTLHYIMNITITVVDKINEIIKSSSIGASGEDILMTTVRNQIANGEDWGQVLTYVLIYCVLAVYTIIFTIQYIRRLIYMAFLTMIAPLITLTYPLDKMKDNKSQAFDMWIKDYIFFALLQVVHLLIYYIFLGSSIDLANKGNWFFAIVAIGFLTNAEKLIKSMFGFEKSKSMGVLAAGATGALVMNAINKIPHGSGGKSSESQSSSGSAENTKGIRTATTNSLGSLTMGASMQNGNTSYRNNSGQSSLQQGNTNNSFYQGSSQQGNTSNSSQSNNTNSSSNRGRSGNNVKTQNSSKPKRNIKGGVKALYGKYSRPVGKAVLGSLTGGAGAMIGFAAGVSQGDFGAAFTGAAAGATAGYALGQKTVDIVPNTVKEIKKAGEEIIDTAREGAYGKEYASNKRVEREFRNDSDFKKLRKNSKFSDREFDDRVEQMLDAGITDTKRMEKILKNNEKEPQKYSMDKAIAYSEMAKICPDGILYDNKKFIRFCQEHKIQITEDELEILRKSIIDFK